MIDNADEEELEDDEVCLCPHGYDALNECPVCDRGFVELTENQEEKCEILLKHAHLSGNYRDSIERLLEGSGQASDEAMMLDLFQMHIHTIHAHQKD